MYEVALTEAYFPVQRDAHRPQRKLEALGTPPRDRIPLLIRDTVERTLSHWFRAKASGGDPTCMSL